jgi:hypothetical protein
VAEVLGTPGDPPNLLMALLPGTSRPDPDEAEAVAPGYLALVAEVHRADPAAFELEQPASMGVAIADELDVWVEFATHTGADEEPLVRLGRRVLTATMPSPDERPAVVHGDVGAGNFMVDDGRVVAMLDWEMCHVGDPHEDLAWLWMRGAHTAFGDPLTRLAEYEAAAGRAVDPDRLRWHLGFVMWKTSVAMHGVARRRSGDEAALVQAVVARTYDALLGAQLVRLTGGTLPLLAQVPVSRPGPQTRMADFVLASDALTKQERIAVTFLRDSAAQAEWERDELVAEVRAAFAVEPAGLLALIDGAGDEQLPALALVVGRAADRAALALPNAVRRIQRAQAIGLGAADEPMPGRAKG